jgi:hypothetical protein
MSVCCCSNPGCRVNGCMQMGNVQRRYEPVTWPVYQSTPGWVSDVEFWRQFIREEVQRAVDQERQSQTQKT